jgi:ABC-type dipeptide/oligopeptide/nickel transport system permease subunit
MLLHPLKNLVIPSLAGPGRATFPGLCIMVTVLGINLLGD